MGMIRLKMLSSSTMKKPTEIVSIEMKEENRKL